MRPMEEHERGIVPDGGCAAWFSPSTFNPITQPLWIEVKVEIIWMRLTWIRALRFWLFLAGLEGRCGGRERREEGQQ